MAYELHTYSQGNHRYVLAWCSFYDHNNKKI